MVLYISLRRIKIFLTRSGAKKRERDRGPLCLQDCIEKPQKKHSIHKILLIASMVAAGVYYLMNSKRIPIKVETQPFIEVFPDTELKSILTERTTMKDVFTYKNNPHNTQNVLNSGEKHLMMQLASREQVLASLHRVEAKKKKLPLCMSRIRTQNITILTKNISANMDRSNNLVSLGGYSYPHDCRSRDKVAIVVPYRDRVENLAVFLYNIHPFLIRQKLEYRIFVVEQNGSDPFNRGCLFNAAFRELENLGRWPCIIFHDVDLLPTDDRILYTCPSIPRHMSAAVIQKAHMPHFRSLFGGVTSMTSKQFRKVNGFSNLYWGWGGEDNDMFWRLKASGMGVSRYSKNIAKYTSLPHNSTPVNKYRYQMLKSAVNRYKGDGLSNVQYSVISYFIRHLYTHIIVDINPKKIDITNFVLSLIEGRSNNYKLK